MFRFVSKDPTMKTATLTRRNGLKTAIVIGLVFGSPPLCAFAAEPPATAQAAGERTAAERKAIKSELQQLQDQLKVLRKNSALKTDHWARTTVNKCRSYAPQSEMSILARIQWPARTDVP